MSSHNPLGPSSRQPPPRPSGSPVLGALFTLSFILNLVLLLIVCGGLLVVLVGPDASEGSLPLTERLYAGESSADDKIAVIKMDGILMEGTLGFVHRQIDTAAKDEDVKAVVLRINSPGGSITASDDLHRRLVDLRDGSTLKGTTGKKHLIVSMGSMAASGGYYIAMPASPIYAERTTMTGSIGVYTAFPNVKKLADDHGVKMIMIKRGEVKGSGSMFSDMSEQERNVWDDMVGTAYQQFIDVVEAGRPQLKGQMLARKPTTFKDEKGDEVKYSRYLADGGIFTADKALELGLIDKVGTLDDAIDEANKAAGLTGDVKVVTYREPFTFSDFLSVSQKKPAAQLDAAALSSALIPRLWYLSPGSEMAGFLSATRP